MGGRGSSSMSGGSKTPAGRKMSKGKMSDALDASSTSELESYMGEKHNVLFDSSFKTLPVGSQKLVCSAIEDVYRAIEPIGISESQVTRNIRRKGDIAHIVLRASNLDNAFAKANSQSITVDRSLFETPSKISSALKRGNLRSKFHASTDTKSSIYHEMGHLLMYRKAARWMHRATDDEVRARRPKKGGIWSVLSNESVSNAAAKIKKTSQGRGKSINTLIGGISGYAKHSRDEAVAEAVADYVSHGKKADSMSKAIVEEIANGF